MKDKYGEKMNTSNKKTNVLDRNERMGLKQKNGKYEVVFPDCSLNFEKIKIRCKKYGIEYEYRGTSEYVDDVVGSRAVRYLYGLRIKHFGGLEFNKHKGLPKRKKLTLIQYRGMGDGFETEYELTKRTIKNTIVLPGMNEINEFVYLIKTIDLTPRLLSDNKKLFFLNNKHRCIISILKPYLYDSLGDYCENVFYSIKQFDKNKYILIIHADSNWINDIDRHGPLYLIFPMRL